MRCLAALCLGPLLARAAPRIGSGIADPSTAIKNWLTERLIDPSGKLSSVLTRVVDRAWRSLEIALAGEQLRWACVEAKADLALIEQVRQFVSVAAITDYSEPFRQRVGVEIRQARSAGLIPGPVPSADALASLILRFLRGPFEETPDADERELATLGPEFRDAGFGSLAEYLERPGVNQAPFLASSARYFLSREIESDLWLLRDLRFTRMELLSDSVRTGFDRLFDALNRFTPVLNELLEQLRIASPAKIETKLAAEPEVAAISSDAGFAIHGIHLVAPIRVDADGKRVAPCPVCLTSSVLPSSARNWVALRCETCGTEFRATDGSSPPPPPPPATPDALLRELQTQKLKLWANSGEPQRWIENRRGMWSEAEFLRLMEMLSFSRFWPMDPKDVRRVLADLTMKHKTRGTNRGSPPPHPTAPPPLTLSSSTALIRTSDLYRTIDGNLWVPCPLCRSFNVEIPARTVEEVTLVCPGCHRAFIAEFRKRPSLLPPPPSRPAVPPPTFWKKVKNWFGV